jgi:hypothetical protein
MPAFHKTWLNGAAAAAALLLLAAGGAHAQSGGGGGGGSGSGGNCGCGTGGGGGGHHHGSPPGQDITVTVIDLANSSATANSQSGSSSTAESQARATGGGGGGVWYEQAPGLGLVQNLDVDTGETDVKHVSFQSTQRVERRVLIQAVCLDDKATPHPASQVHPERDVTDDYDGEVFRCIAGTRLQATIGDFNEQLTLTKGDALTCDKGQALYHSPGGAVACRAQKPARDCNERSLLRRYGPGLKVLKLVREETVTASRDETVERAKVGGMITLDGGVGGFH